MPKLLGTLFKRTRGVLPTFSKIVDMIFLRASLMFKDIDINKISIKGKFWNIAYQPSFWDFNSS